MTIKHCVKYFIGVLWMYKETITLVKNCQKLPEITYRTKICGCLFMLVPFS